MAVQDEIKRSRLTLTYVTKVEGKSVPVSLPLRFLVMGDFSKGSSVDAQLAVEDRKLRSVSPKNLNAIMKDMDMSLPIKVKNCINPESAGKELDLKLQINNMSSFSPETVAQQIPIVRSLLTMKALLNEMQSDIANKKELRRILSEVLADPKLFASLQEELSAYKGYRLPEKTGGESSK